MCVSNKGVFKPKVRPTSHENSSDFLGCSTTDRVPLPTKSCVSRGLITTGSCDWGSAKHWVFPTRCLSLLPTGIGCSRVAANRRRIVFTMVAGKVSTTGFCAVNVRVFVPLRLQ